MYSIGELSRRTGVKIPTIRYYEQRGLIAAPERSAGNQRRYSKGGLERLSFIRHSRELGFSLEDIGELLALSQHPKTPCDNAHAIAARHIKQIRAKLSKLKRLEKQLGQMSDCATGSVSGCSVIETLADHSLCATEH